MSYHYETSHKWQSTYHCLKNCINLRLDQLFIRLFVCLFVHSILRLKFLVKLDFSEADVRSWWNFTQMTINISFFKKLCRFDVVTLCPSVCSSVCSSIQFRLKFLVKLVFSEADVLSWWNFTQMTINISFFKKLCRFDVVTLCPSVCSSVCSSIQFRLKFLVKLVFSEADVRSWWNFTQMTINISFFKKLCRFDVTLCPSVCSFVFHQFTQPAQVKFFRQCSIWLSFHFFLSLFYSWPNRGIRVPWTHFLVFY